MPLKSIKTSILGNGQRYCILPQKKKKGIVFNNDIHKDTNKSIIKII